MIIAGYLQKEHPVEPKAVLAMVNQIQEWVKSHFPGFSSSLPYGKSGRV